MQNNPSVIDADWFHTAFQQSPSGIALLDADYRLILANKRFLEMTGYTEKDLIHPSTGIPSPGSQPLAGEKSFLDIISPSDLPWVMANIRKGINGEETPLLPCSVVHKDGALVPALLKVSAIEKTDQGAGVLIYLHEEKDLQGKRSETYRPWEMGASGTMLAEVAHDFNDLLFLMLVNMEYIKDNLRGDKDLADHIAAALDAGKQAKNLVLQLHNFSRQTCTTHCPVRVGAVVKETLELFKVSLLPSITIKTDILSDAIIMADPDLMQKILLNLIANAEYAMRSKGGTIGIKLEEVELDATSLPVSKGMKKGTCLKLTVRDNGPGISAEALKHIFEPPFTTAKRMDMDNAYGIGFNTVYDIVESHGGLITVDSEIDKGSTFEILLPIYEHIQDAQEKPIVRLTGGTERILLVDDEKDFTVISQELLQPLGYKVTTKTDSREALRFFQENPDQFDLVITDMLMPDVSGDQLAKEIFVLRPKLPIILCTGFSLFNMKEEAAAIGIRAIVRKPVILAELVGTIRKVLDERMV